MRQISAAKIKNIVSRLAIQANSVLRDDIVARLKKAYLGESNKFAKDALLAILKNAEVAKFEQLAICQDTGLPCVFVEIGQDVRVKGNLKKAIHEGVEMGYKKGFLRNSVVPDPLLRGVTGFAPAVVHFDIIAGDKIKLTVMPKGFGCENKTQLKMFKPTAGIEEIKEFIVSAVKSAGPDACPPYTVGVGIGGTADYACYLAKKALLRMGLSSKGTVHNLERDLLEKINKLKIGPMGLGGKDTCLSVNIETYPTHIAGLPVCVNISCHALRSASAVI